MIRFLSTLFMLVGILSAGSLSARLEDHFKKITNKTSGHSIKRVDFIYMINLDERPEKFQTSLDQLQPYGIVPFRFSAVNGWKLTLQEINDVGVRYAPGMTTDFMGTYYPMDDKGEPTHEIMHVPGRNYFTYGTSRGVIGCSLSHLSVLQDAYDSGYKTIWVMEDDIRVVRDPHLMSKAIKKLDSIVGKKNWDILFTETDTIDNRTGVRIVCSSYAPRPNFTPSNPQRFSERKMIGKSFLKIGARYGTHSYIIRRSGMRKILEFLKQYSLFLPIDMDMFLPNDLKVYSVVDGIVSVRPHSPSDNGAPRYQK